MKFEHVLHPHDFLSHVGASQVFEEFLFVGCEVVEVLHLLHEVLLELVSSPLDGVLDLIGVVLESAHFEFFLLGVPAVSIALGFSRDDDLHVGFDSLGACVDQRLLLHDALLVDEESRV